MNKGGRKEAREGGKRDGEMKGIWKRQRIIRRREGKRGGKKGGRINI